MSEGESGGDLSGRVVQIQGLFARRDDRARAEFRELVGPPFTRWVAAVALLLGTIRTGLITESHVELEPGSHEGIDADVAMALGLAHSMNPEGWPDQPPAGTTLIEQARLVEEEYERSYA